MARQRAKRWAKRLVMTLLVVLVVMALALLLLQTPWGKNAVVDLVAGTISARMDGEIQIGRVTGAFPFHMRIDELEVSDATGTWLDVQSLSVDISAMSLLRRNVHIEDVGVEHVTLHRRPVREKPRPMRLPDLPQLPEWLRVDQARVATLELKEEVVGAAAAFEISGHFLPPRGDARWDIVIDANRVDAIGTHAVVNAQATVDALQLTVDVHDEVIVPGLLDAEGPLELLVEGDGPRAEWQGDISALLGGRELVQGSIHLDAREDTDIELGASIQLDHPVFPESAVAHLGQKFILKLEGALAPDGQLTIETLEALTPLATAMGRGMMQLRESTLDMQGTVRHRQPGLFLDPVKELPPAEIDLQLRGALEELTVALEAALGDSPVLETALTLALTEAIRAEGTGRVWPHEALVPEAVIMRLPEGVQLEFDVARGSEGRIDVAGIKASGKGINVAAQGFIDPEASTVDARVSGNVQRLQQMVGETEMQLDGALEFDGYIQGNRDQTEFAVDFEAANVQAPEASFPEIKVRAEGSFAGGFGTDLRDGVMAITGQTAEATFQEKPVPATDLRGRVQLPDRNRVVVESLELTDGHGTLNAAGTYARDTEAADLVATVHGPLEPYRQFLGIDASGIVHAEAKAAKAADATWQIQVTGNAQDLAGLPEPAPALLAGTVSYAAEVQIAEQTLVVQSLSLEGAQIQATADGSLNRDTKEVALNASVAIPNLATAGAVFDTDLAGRLTADVTGSGTLDALALVANLAVADPVLGPLTGRRLEATAELAQLTENPAGKVTVRLIPLQDAPPLELAADIAVEGDVLRMPSVVVTQADNRMSGRLDVYLESKQAAGQFAIDAPDLASLAALTNVPVAGRAQGTVNLARDGALDATVQAANLQWAEVTLAEATVEARATRVFENPEGSGTIDLQGVIAANGAFERVHIEARGGREQIEFAANVDGIVRDETPVTLELAAAVAPDERRVDLSAITGAFGNYPFALQQPTVLAMDEGGWRVQPATLTIGDGALQVQGVVSPEQVDIDGRFNDVPLGILQLLGGPSVEGIGGGVLRVTGTGDAPQGQITLQLDQVRRAEGPPDAPPATVNLVANLAPDRVQAELDVTAGDALNARGDAVLPVTFRMWPWSFEIGGDAPLEGNLDLHGDLAAAPTFLVLPEHKINGVAEASLRIGGTRAAPAVSGDGTLRNGRYENIDTGTILTKIEADIQGEKNLLRLARFNAEAGPDGSVRAEGEVSFTRGQPLAFDATITLTNARVVHRDDASARAGGELRLHGTLEEIRVEGALTAGPAEIGLPEMAGEDIAELEVTEVNAPPERLAVLQEQRESSAVDRTIHLDFTVSVPGRVFVRGRGLDSEWKGDVQVGGHPDEPRLRGVLTVVRGHIDFLGRRFEFVDSTVTFNGQSPPDPYLNLNAVAESGDVTARLAMTGTLDQLDLALTSDPPLPRDEILSRVLFGRSLEQITPLQALQLAHSAAILTGRVRGLLFLAGANRLGIVDRLELRQTGTGVDDTALGVGKYIGDKIYVELEQSLGETGSRAKVEVDLRPQIKLEAEVGSDNRQGIGLFWKKDY